MKRKENFQLLPKELHQLKYEAISVPQGSVLLVKKTLERKSSTCYLLITKGVTSSSPVPLKTRRFRRRKEEESGASLIKKTGFGRPVVKVLDHGWHVMSSSLVPLKTRHVGERCTVNMSRAQISSYWCGVVVRRGAEVSSTSLDHGSK
ncbi:uncharacterized protein TNCV_2334381 [Trichonephila clavipes]|nr:uncharacterized protein TNCV_2334381 [Trichonephila clavipes]